MTNYVDGFIEKCKKNKKIAFVIIFFMAWTAFGNLVEISKNIYSLIPTTNAEIEFWVDKISEMQLDFKIKNVGNEIALLRSIEITVLNSTVDYSPVIMYTYRYYEPHKISFTVRNRGWGPAKNVTIRDFYNYSEKSLTNPDNLSELISIFDLRIDNLSWQGNLPEGSEVNITTIYEKDFIFNNEVCAGISNQETSYKFYDYYGIMEYWDIYGNKQIQGIGLDSIVIKNKTICRYEDGRGGGLSPSAEYNATLESESKTPYSIKIPISHVLEPNKGDRFLLDLDSDKTSTYRIKVNVNYDNYKTKPEYITIKIEKPNYERAFFDSVGGELRSFSNE